MADNRRDSAPHACAVTAEVGSVHDGSLGNAIKVIDVAARAGADAVKFQTHIAEAETLRDAPMSPYFMAEPRYEYFERTSFSKDQWREIRQACGAHNIEFHSSPFSHEAVALLEDVGVTRYKIASGEVTNFSLLEAVAQTGKPVTLSSGMSSWQELDDAVDCLRRHHDCITVLQCTSAYPCPYDLVGLNVMAEMKDRYGLAVGLSDHTLKPYASLAAVVLGATAIEKHITFSRLMYGSDAPHSLEPLEFSSLVEGIRAIEVMLASPVNKDKLVKDLEDTKRVFEKSVVSVEPISAGTVIAASMVAVKKPGTGIPARRLNDVIGRRAKRDIPKDSLLREEDLGA